MSLSNPSEWSHRIETITPEDADKMLSVPVRNRAISQKQVNRFVRDILSGKWMTSPQTISLNKDGGVIDGQHRLAAVSKVGRDHPELGFTAQFLVVRGVDETVWSVLDRGRKRTSADGFHAAGIANSNKVAAAATVLKRYVDDLWVRDFAWTDEDKLRLILHEHPRMMAYMNESIYMQRNSKVPQPTGMAGLYLTSLADLSWTQRTWKEFYAEVGLRRGVFFDGSPTAQFVDHMMALDSRRGWHKGMSTVDRQRLYLGLFARTWELWVIGADDVKQIRFTTSSPVGCMDAPPRTRNGKPRGPRYGVMPRRNLADAVFNPALPRRYRGNRDALEAAARRFDEVREALGADPETGAINGRVTDGAAEAVANWLATPYTDPMRTSDSED